jgi:hypothetical protein
MSCTCTSKHLRNDSSIWSGAPQCQKIEISAMSNFPVESPHLKSTFALSSKTTYETVCVENTPSLGVHNRYLTSKGPTQVWRHGTHPIPKLNPLGNMRSRSGQPPSKTTPAPSETIPQLQLDALQRPLPDFLRVRVCTIPLFDFICRPVLHAGPLRSPLFRLRKNLFISQQTCNHLCQ